MEKEYYAMQTLHNQFMRGVVTSICKIFLLTLAYGSIVGLISGVAASASADILSSEVSSASSSIYSSSSKNDGGSNANMPFVVGGVTIVLISVAYWVMVGHEVGGKINAHKELTATEDERLGLNSSVVRKNTTKTKAVTKTENNSKKYDDSDDDML